jgi:hypothetical protein
VTLMSVDIDSRRIVCEAIHAYVNDEIDNFRFDDILGECHTSDGLCNAIIGALWYFYDDCTRCHFPKHWKSAEAQAPYLERWERLLQTSIDFDEAERARVVLNAPSRPGIWGKVNDLFYGKRPGFASNPFWPLSSSEEWSALGIPYDDSMLHGCPRN